MVASDTEKASERSRTRALPSSCSHSRILIRRGSASRPAPASMARCRADFSAGGGTDVVVPLGPDLAMAFLLLRGATPAAMSGPPRGRQTPLELVEHDRGDNHKPLDDHLPELADAHHHQAVAQHPD